MYEHKHCTLMEVWRTISSSITELGTYGNTVYISGMHPLRLQLPRSRSQKWLPTGLMKNGNNWANDGVSFDKTDDKTHWDWFAFTWYLIPVQIRSKIMKSNWTKLYDGLLSRICKSVKIKVLTWPGRDILKEPRVLGFIFLYKFRSLNFYRFCTLIIIITLDIYNDLENISLEDTKPKFIRKYFETCYTIPVSGKSVSWTNIFQ